MWLKHEKAYPCNFIPALVSAIRDFQHPGENLEGYPVYKRRMRLESGFLCGRGGLWLVGFLAEV